MRFAYACWLSIYPILPASPYPILRQTSERWTYRVLATMHCPATNALFFSKGFLRLLPFLSCVCDNRKTCPGYGAVSSVSSEDRYVDSVCIRLVRSMVAISVRPPTAIGNSRRSLAGVSSREQKHRKTERGGGCNSSFLPSFFAKEFAGGDIFLRPRLLD